MQPPNTLVSHCVKAPAPLRCRRQAAAAPCIPPTMVGARAYATAKCVAAVHIHQQGMPGAAHTYSAFSGPALTSDIKQLRTPPSEFLQLSSQSCHLRPRGHSKFFAVPAATLQPGSTKAPTSRHLDNLRDQRRHHCLAFDVSRASSMAFERPRLSLLLGSSVNFWSSPAAPRHCQSFRAHFGSSHFIVRPSASKSSCPSLAGWNTQKQNVGGKREDLPLSLPVFGAGAGTPLAHATGLASSEVVGAAAARTGGLR